MEELAVKLRILARAELSLIKADAHRRTNRMLLTLLSIGCILVALVFVNFGAFFMLTEAPANAKAGFILAAVNFALALVPYFIARNTVPGSEEQMVREIREMAAEEITRDVSRASAEVREVADSLKDLRGSVRSLAGGGGASASALVTLLPTLIDLLKKARGK